MSFGNASGWMKRAGSVGFHVPSRCCHCLWNATCAWKPRDMFLTTVICAQLLTEVGWGVGSSEARRIIEGKFIQVARSPQAFLQELEAGWSRDVSRTMPKFNAKMLDPWLCYTRYMDERGISHEVQKKMMTGLNRDNKDDVGGTWVVQPRLVIPHFFGGRLRGWSMRKLSSEQLGPKYKHTGEFPKRNTLYNWDNAVAFDSVIVTESPMSVLGLMSKGIENVVATFGAEVND